MARREAASPLKFWCKYLGGWSKLAGPKSVLVQPQAETWTFLAVGRGRDLTHLAELSTSAISSVDLAELTSEHARGWTVATGFWGSGRQVPGTSLMRVVLHSGEQLLFEMTGNTTQVGLQLGNVIGRWRSTQVPGGGAWHPDPTGRHEQRFWNGASWTEHVSDRGVAGTDPV